MAEKGDLNKLKKDYKKIQEKYNLPSFRELNEDFQIEKIAETETDIVIREVRKFMTDKFVNYMKLIETILNPVNAPMFVFSILKTIKVEEKKKLEEIYKELAKNEIKLIGVDIKFSEEKEAEFIKSSYELWQKIKKEILTIMGAIERNWGNKFGEKGCGYFG